MKSLKINIIIFYEKLIIFMKNKLYIQKITLNCGI